MPELTGYWEVNLSDMVEELGEDEVKNLISSFSSCLNRDVEQFLHEKAIEFAKQGLAATHLVYTSHKGETVLVGYYALATKVFVIKKPYSLPDKLRKRLARFAKFDPVLRQATISAPLIAQLSKNFTNGYDRLITGDELLKLACDRVQAIQRNIGGRMVYLECGKTTKLVEFYKRNGFKEFDERNLDKADAEANGNSQLVQMLKYFGK